MVSLLVLGAALSGLALMTRPGQVEQGADPRPAEAESASGSTIVLGGGCFWCLEPLFEMLKGVRHVEVGYAGGVRAGLTYEEVCRGDTGAAEVVKVTYDPAEISLEDLLRIFFTVHDPTTLNRQGPDVGTQYRSVIFYADEEQKATAQRIIDEIAAAGIWENKIVTTLEPLAHYTRAEEYHQDYFQKFQEAGPVERMRMNAGYCTAIVAPKVTKFREQFADRIRR